jgi:hypothetical protein
MCDHAALDCRLVFSLDTPPDQRRQITKVIETSTFARTGVVPRRVVWTFGSVLFQVSLPPQLIVESIIASVPRDAMGELLIGGRKVWRD